MQDKIFIDSNVWIYLFSKNPIHKEKEGIIINLIRNYEIITISNQVLNEFSNVFYKKYKTPSSIIKSHIENILSLVKLHIISERDIFQALDLIDNYSISFYDALIVSSALFSGCNILYTEDMHHNQLIENKVRIINPFKE